MLYCGVISCSVDANGTENMELRDGIYKIKNETGVLESRVS